MNRERVVEWSVLIALVVIWGSAFAAIKTAVDDLPPAWVVAGRLWLGAATLVAMMVFQRERLPPLRDPVWLWYGIIGVLCTAVPFGLFAFAAEILPSAVSAICNGATPVFTALIAHFAVASERLTGRKALGVGLGFVGLAVLVGPEALRGFEPGSAAPAMAAALLGAAGYGVGSVLTRKAPAVGATGGALIFCLTGAVAATAFAIPQAGLPPPLSLDATLAVLFLGVGPTGVASAMWVWLVIRRGAVFTSLATYLSPVWATLLGVVVLAERPSLTAYAALALILLGVAVASRPPRAAAGSR